MAILAAILVPSVNGYIVRSRKTEVIKQCREMYKAIETYNITADEKIKYDETTILDFYPSDKSEKKYIGPIFTNDDAILEGTSNQIMGAIADMTLAQLKEIATAEDGDILDRIVLRKSETAGDAPRSNKRSPYVFKELKSK